MPTLRCSLCNINYPVRGHRTCEVCGEKCDPVNNDKPHEDWEERVAAGKRELEESDLSEIPTIITKVYEHDGLLFISSHDVCNSGYCSVLDTDKIIIIDDEYYEINGYSYSRREYWISPAQDLIIG